MSELRTTITIVGAALLAALSVILQVLPPFFLTPFFMRIDLVAVPWVLAWILFGFRSSLLSLVISVPIVGVMGPFAGGWVGAIMKSVASVWMFLVPALFAWRLGMGRLLANKWLYTTSAVAAIVVRDIVTIVFNLYFAIPFFFGMSATEVIQFFSTPTFQSFFGLSIGLVGLGAYLGETAFWNSVQGAIDLYAALIVGLIVLRQFPRLRRN
ncbi:MAG: hypothetical protein GTN80_05695 [Nitrososphaeria archaeon]|nr:hypothetical protein [Nitrososphaeria archaeon]NIN52642.1 hypothetical protein [Nitrososphaeria archaeon]NIQ33117.1 hypothetical protein [Nitrososphaeria archaeon]